MYPSVCSVPLFVHLCSLCPQLVNLLCGIDEFYGKYKKNRTIELYGCVRHFTHVQALLILKHIRDV